MGLWDDFKKGMKGEAVVATAKPSYVIPPINIDLTNPQEVEDYVFADAEYKRWSMYNLPKDDNFEKTADGILNLLENNVLEVELTEHEMNYKNYTIWTANGLHSIHCDVKGKTKARIDFTKAQVARFKHILLHVKKASNLSLANKLNLELGQSAEENMTTIYYNGKQLKIPAIEVVESLKVTHGEYFV